MISHITLRNFQCHRRFSADLNSLTMFVGISGQGKSSILRALLWLATNRPSGDSFIRRGAKFTKVKVVVDDHTIVRKKGKGVNCYILDGKRFDAMGRDVPEPIANLLNLGELNYHDQHSSVFWFNESPGYVSRQLNSIVNLGVIDSSLSNIATKLNQSKSAVEITQLRLTTAKDKKESLSWVRDADEELQQLEQLEQRIEKRRTESLLLNDLVSNVVQISSERDRLSSAVLDAGNTIVIGEKILTKQKRIDLLKKLIGEYTEAEQITSIPVPNFEKLDTLRNRIEKKDDDINSVRGLMKQIEYHNGEICKNESLVKGGLRDLAKDKTCPLCLQPTAYAR